MIGHEQHCSFTSERSQRTLCTAELPEDPLVLQSQSPLDIQRHFHSIQSRHRFCCQSHAGNLVWLVHLHQTSQILEPIEEPLKQRDIGLQPLQRLRLHMLQSCRSQGTSESCYRSLTKLHKMVFRITTDTDALFWRQAFKLALSAN